MAGFSKLGNMAKAKHCVDFFLESWQNGYCNGLENRRPQGLGSSNLSLSAKDAQLQSYLDNIID